MSYERWSIDDNHKLAVAKWDGHPTVIWFLYAIRQIHNKILAVACRRAPFNQKYQDQPPW